MENITIYANFTSVEPVLFEVKADTKNSKQQVVFESVLYGECVKYLERNGFELKKFNALLKKLLDSNIMTYNASEIEYDALIIDSKERDFIKSEMLKANMFLVKNADSKSIVKMMYNRFIRANKKNYEADFYIHDIDYMIDKSGSFVWVCKENGSNIIPINLDAESYQSYLDYHLKNYKDGCFYIVNIDSMKIKRMNINAAIDLKEMSFLQQS